VDIAINGRDAAWPSRIKSFTDQRGADVAIEASGFYNRAARGHPSVAYSQGGGVWVFFQGAGQGSSWAKEFHHNRVNVVCSQISAVNPELTYRWNPPRLIKTAMQLQADGVIESAPRSSPKYTRWQRPPKPSACATMSRTRTIQVVLDFTK